MASFYGGCGEVPPQPSGWQRPDASRFINNAGEGGQVTALAQWCSTSAMGLVSRVTPVQTAKRNCTSDEGGPFEFGNQVLKPPQAVAKSDGGERCGSVGDRIPARYGRERRAQANRCRSVESGLGDVKT